MLPSELIMWDFTFILLIAASAPCLKNVSIKKKSSNLPIPKPNSGVSVLRYLSELLWIAGLCSVEFKRERRREGGGKRSGADLRCDTIQNQGWEDVGSESGEKSSRWAAGDPVETRGGLGYAGEIWPCLTHLVTGWKMCEKRKRDVKCGQMVFGGGEKDGNSVTKLRLRLLTCRWPVACGRWRLAGLEERPKTDGKKTKKEA